MFWRYPLVSSDRMVPSVLSTRRAADYESAALRTYKQVSCLEQIPPEHQVGN